MNRLAMIATTCVLGLLLTACDKGAKPTTTTNTTTTVEHTQDKDGSGVKTDETKKTTDTVVPAEGN